MATDLATTSTPERLAALPERVRSKIKVQPNGCWIWVGTRSKRNGYGRIGWRTAEGYNSRSAHRVVYELLVGPIPEGLQIDHVAARGCTSKSCVCPDHLEPVTARENLLRSDRTLAGRNARATHCVNGHEFTTENVYRGGDGYRNCRTCRALNDTKRRARLAQRRAA